MPELPQGTVTFAFTDIEGSTLLLKQLGEGYADVLAAHRGLLRGSFTAHGGVEIDTQGDAFFFAFVRARDAVAATAEVQLAHVAYAWPHGGEVRMRIGLHTGEPTLGEEGYLGLDVVRAARLCGVGHGGQVLLSETTRALLGSTMPRGVSLFPLGERHLKDIDEPERLYELQIEGVELPPVPRVAPAQTPERLSRSKKKRHKQWEEDFERRVEDFAERTAERVLGKLERDSEGVDGIAARADELVRGIEREIRPGQSDIPDGGAGSRESESEPASRDDLSGALSLRFDPVLEAPIRA